MKKIIATIGAVLVAAVIHAAPITNAPAPPPTTSSGIWNWLTTTPMTNVEALTYATYLPSSSGKKADYGAGVGIMYQLLPISIVQAKTGLLIDYLDAVQIVSANVSFDVPLHPLAHLSSSSWAQNFETTPFTVTALGLSWGANNQTAPNVAVGAGLDVNTGFKNVHVFSAWVNRSGGAATGNTFEFGVAIPL